MITYNEETPRSERGQAVPQPAGTACPCFQEQLAAWGAQLEAVPKGPNFWRALSRETDSGQASGALGTGGDGAEALKVWGEPGDRTTLLQFPGASCASKMLCRMTASLTANKADPMSDTILSLLPSPPAQLCPCPQSLSTSFTGTVKTAVRAA